MSRAVLQFGDFALDLDSAELTRSGRSVQLAALPRRLLRYLGLNRHRTVPKAELLREVWGGVAVEESALHQALKHVRRAVGDDGRRQVVVETVTGVGYRFAAAVVERPHLVPAPPGSYVGRTALCHALEHRVDAAAAGRGGVVLLAGEPGIGKSRTCDELVGYAAQRGMLDVRGGGNPRAGAPPFWPWIEAFRELTASRPVEELRRVAPALLDPAATSSARELGEAERFRQLDVANRCLHRAGALGAILVILEDLHEASAASLELLEFVARGLERAPVLVAATYREPELRRDAARTRALSSLVSLRSVAAHEVAALSEPETATLIERHARRTLPPALVRALARRSSGNPLFAVELARQLGESNAGAPQPVSDARSEGSWEEWIPRGAGLLLANRLAALTPEARHSMRIAAAIGSTFDTDLLTRADPTNCARASLDEAAALRLVVEADADFRSYRFTHALIRDALYDGFEQRPQERREIHLRLAEALADAGIQRAAEAAFHFGEAHPLGDPERAASFARRAARQAAAVGDASSAWALYRRAQGLLANTQASDRLRCELLVEAGEIGVRGPSSDLARGRLADALLLARELGDGELFGRAALADTYRAATVSEVEGGVVDLLEEALGRLDPGARALRAQILSRLARETRYQAGGLGRALERTEQALAEARASGDSRALARVLEDVTFVRWSGDDPEGWIALNDEIVREATRAGDADLRFRGLKGLATGYLEVGDRSAADREIARCSRAAEEYPSPYLRAVTANLHAMQAFLAGDFRSAERGAMETASSALAAVQPPASAQLYYHRLETGRSDELEAAVRALVTGAPAVRGWRFALARLLVDGGRFNEARDVLASAGDLDEIPRDRNWLIGMALLAECLVHVPDSVPASDLFERLRPYARLNVVLGNGSLFYGNTSHFLGLLAASDRRDSEARDLFDAAMAVHERMKAAPWVLHTQVEQAELCARSGDVDRAHTLAAGVAESARGLGMRRLTERACAIVSGLHG